MAAPALAQRSVAPPGNSAIDEYLETVPGVSGNRQLTGNPAGRGPGLPAAARRRLEALGAQGALAARLFDASLQSEAPPRAPSRSETPEHASGGDSGLPAVVDNVLIGA